MSNILSQGKKVYFASDFHLGVPDAKSSLERERRIVRWLDQAKNDAQEIFLVGDLFDFWFEYKYVIPKGHVRLLGKLAELKDLGIEITVFTGNHDMWMFGYFEKEFGIPVFHKPIERTWGNTRFFIGHGDGLGPGDLGYKVIKKIFRNRLCQVLFSTLPTRWGIGLANYFSRSSRAVNGEHDARFLGEEKEWLVLYSREILEKEHYDFFIFGHRHLPLDIKLNEQSRYINLGDWLRYNTFAQWDGSEMKLLTFES